MKKIRAIYWDLDGTVYRFRKESNHNCSRSAARAARACGATESEDWLYDHFCRVMNPHHYPDSLKNNSRFDRLDYHHRYHDGIDVNQMVEEMDGVREAFAHSRLSHVLVTHSSRPWAQRALTKLRLRQYFSDERIFGLEDLNFSGKDVSVEAYRQVLGQLGHNPAEVVMVEDSPRNLVHAHALGMTTVLLNHREPLLELPKHVDAQCFHVADVLEMLEKPARRRVLTPHCA